MPYLFSTIGLIGKYNDASVAPTPATIPVPRMMLLACAANQPCVVLGTTTRSCDEGSNAAAAAAPASASPGG